MEIFALSVNAILPTFALVALGMFLRGSGALGDETVQQFNAVSFGILIPAMFFLNVYNTGGRIVLSFTLVVFIVVVHVMEYMVAMVLERILHALPEQKGVVQQSIFRSNMILFGTAIATAVLSPEELGLYSLAMMFILPLQNLGGSLAQGMYSLKEEKAGIKSILWDIVRNPLSIGVISGFAFASLGISLPEVVQSTLSQMSACALPMGGLLLGASLSINNMRDNLRLIVPVSMVKLLVLPAMTVPLIPLFGLSFTESYILLMVCAAPSATMTYTISLVEGWDVELACEIIIFDTVASFFTLTFWTTVLLGMM